MITIIMSQTIPLICLKQDDLDSLLKNGFVVKELKGEQYLVKYEK